jgi:hypothetical protein
MVRFHPGSLHCENTVSVGAVAARRRGKAEDWVQFPDGPLTEHGRLVQREDAWLATRRSGFDSPAGPLNEMGSSSNGTIAAASVAEIRVRWEALLQRVMQDQHSDFPASFSLVHHVSNANTL